MKVFSTSLFFIGLFVFSIPAFAEPYTPSDPEEVIERIPEALRGTGGKEFSALRKKIEAEPQDREAAIQFIRMNIEQGRRLNDPRHFGYAEAVVDARLKSAPGDVDLLVFRAMIRERKHDFSGAKQDLHRVVEKIPNNAQAWATLASVQTVTGEFEEAQSSCLKLAALATPIVAGSCISLVSSLTGQAAKSYEVLNSLLANEGAKGAVTPAEGLWVNSILAEIAERLGRKSEAESWYKKSLSVDPNDSFTLAAYSDFLLSERREAEVRALLAEKADNDPLLLRLLIAEKALRSPDYEAHRKIMKSHLHAEMERGEGVHLRERGIFQLLIEDDPQAALESSLGNWAVQKEATDLLLLARAAQASNDAAALSVVREWITKTKWEDVRVGQIIDGGKA